MAQQPQATSQIVLGPVNQGGDVLHVLNNSNVTVGWTDKNNFAQGVSTVVSALQGGAAAQLTGTTGGTFTPALSAPGASALEQIPFTVKAAGYVSLGAGTYTATVQPLIYASTSAGFTSSAAAAVLSVTAVSMTISSAAATVFPWEGEASVCGDSTSGKLTVIVSQRINNGAQQFTVPVAAPAANIPTSVNFASAVPLQFLVGVTLSNATTPIVNLGSFFLES